MPESRKRGTRSKPEASSFEAERDASKEPFAPRNGAWTRSEGESEEAVNGLDRPMEMPDRNGRREREQGNEGETIGCQTGIRIPRP